LRAEFIPELISVGMLLSRVLDERPNLEHKISNIEYYFADPNDGENVDMFCTEVFSYGA